MKYKSYQRKDLSGLPYRLTMLFACLFALGCTSENDSLTVADDVDGGEIQLGASVNLETRATGQGFELNDRIGLYLAKWPDATTPGMLSNTGNYADNALFELNTLPDSWTTTPKRYYPADGGALDFYAYYPYRDSAFATGTTLNLTVASDQSAYADYTRSDFMVARTNGVKRSTSKVHLDFYHRLSQMVFVLKPGVGFTVSDLLGAKVKVVNAVVDGTFDLSQGASGRPTEGSTRQDVTPYGTWTVGDSSLTGMMAIVMPQYIDARTYVEVTVGSRKFAFKPTTPIEMRPGCSKEFTITVSNTGIDIETQIHPWNNCGAESGDGVEEEEPKEAIVRMTTALRSVRAKVAHVGDIYVDWGDGSLDTNVFRHTYTDGAKHEIVYYGTREALLSLDFSGNDLESLDVTKNMALMMLDCNYNLLKSLDVSKNTMLTTLVCDLNELDSLNVFSNSNLINLNCGENLLERVDVSNNLKLRKFNCSKNQLKSIDVSKNLALTTLSCGDNPMEGIDIRNNTALTKLECDNNQFSSLDVSMALNLDTLSVRNNQLDVLQISNNSKLEVLHVNNNELAMLNVEENKLLKKLDCSNNPIGSLMLSQNVRLLYLYCNSCGLDTLNISANVALMRLSVATNRLAHLDISQNAKLTHVRCTDNPFFDDPIQVASFVRSLPDRTGELEVGWIVPSLSFDSAIEDLCFARFWGLTSNWPMY